MATFTINNPALVGRIFAPTGTISNFSGGSVAELQDLIGDTFVGGTAGDIFVTGNGNDTIAGQGGNDDFLGGGGADVMAGDEGNDIFYFAASTDIPSAGEQIFGGSGVDSIRLQGASSVDFSLYNTFVDSIERVELGDGGLANNAIFNASAVGGGLASNLVVHSFTTFSVLTFRMNEVSNLNLSGFTFSGTAVYVETVGDDDAEVIYGSVGTDIINTAGGADTLWSSYGPDGFFDFLTGGAGNDTYFVYNTADAVTETDANPLIGGIDLVYSYASYTLGANVEHLTLFGNNGALSAATGNGLDNALNAMQYTGGSGITFNANDGNDTVFGSYYADNIFGGNGNDTLWGSWGADGRVDAMAGGNGADTYFVQETLDTVTETNTSTAPSELDTVYSAINMTLGANIENLFIYGNATLAIGNSLNNAVIGSYSGLQLSLNGGAGNDYIVGGAGNDTIDGNAGVDFLHGSGGADRFVFVAGEADGDVINDFNGAGAGALDNLRFLGYGGDVTFTQISPTQWMLLWDGGQFSETITFNNAASIHASDYVFV